jgi:hypothetical protein
MSRLVCVGDSHAEIFYKTRNRYASLKNTLVLSVAGATNMGIKNPHSKTKARPKIDAFLEKNLNKSDTLVFLMGEVDCGFVIWYRKEKYNDTLESQFNESINNYFDLILSYKDKCNSIIVCDVPPPTIGDNLKNKGNVANKRLGIKATQLERTKLSMRYNKMISEFCEKNGFKYLKYMDGLLNENGVVDAKYMNHDPSNHHLNNDKFSIVLGKKLNKVKL